jgi:hypothetical protein
VRPDRRLRAALGAGGAIATAAGVHTMLAGGRSFPPWRRGSAMVESELRFYAGFYAAYGLALLRAAASAEADPRAVRALAGTLFLGGLGRANAWARAGSPHPLQRALLAIELTAPVAIMRLSRARQIDPS